MSRADWGGTRNSVAHWMPARPGRDKGKFWECQRRMLSLLPSPEREVSENGAASPDVPSARACLTFAAFWIVAAEAAAAASAFEASARVRFRVPKVPPPAPHTCQQACASVWSMPNQGLSRLNPGTAQLHAGSREHPCANKHSVAESFPHTSKNMHVWQSARGRPSRIDAGSSG